MNAAPFESLSDREKEVLRLLASGHEAKSVAQVLGLSVHTVNEYLRSARRKLDAPNSRAAARAFSAFEEANPKNLGTPEFLGDQKNGEAQSGINPQVMSSTGSRTPRRTLMIRGLLAMFVVLAAVVAVSTGMVTVGTPQQPAPAVAANVLPADAVASAESFLKLLDDKQWTASHQAMGAVVRTSVSDSEWQNTVAPVRESLGAFVSRSVGEGKRDTMLPGMPEGDYGMQQFNARFANQSAAVETVVLMREQSGWKVIGYFVR